MIYKNHEDSPLFARYCGDIGKKQESTLIQRSKICLSKKCAVFAFGKAMQWSEQFYAFPTGLFVFMMQLQ